MAPRSLSDVSPLKGKRVAIVGYGSQGRAHAANLRDSGIRDLRVALPAGSSSKPKAEADGFSVTLPAEAVAWADVVMLLAPDELQPAIYETDIGPHLRDGASLAFAHGFAVHFGYIVPSAGVDVWMVAPKEVGPAVRARYQAGGGAPCLLAVHQDATGQARALALAYAEAMGCCRGGMMETTFKDECEVDLFGEQAVLIGGVPSLMRAAFETLVEAGYSPEMAYFKCVQQVKLVTDVIHQGGIAALSRVISNTAEYGGYVAGPRLVTKQTKGAMKALLTDIQSGNFARDWMKENQAGKAGFSARRQKDAKHSVELAGEALRIRNNIRPA